jgi:hypothetical protein
VKLTRLCGWHGVIVGGKTVFPVTSAFSKQYELQQLQKLLKKHVFDVTINRIQ